MRIRATIEVMKGKYMFEVEVVEGMVRVGVGCAALNRLLEP